MGEAMDLPEIAVSEGLFLKGICTSKCDGLLFLSGLILHRNASLGSMIHETNFLFGINERSLVSK